MTRLATNDRRLQAHYRSDLEERREELLQQQLRVFREGLIRRHYTDAEVDTQVAALEQRLRDKMI
ncbi:hypothetical protein EHM76_00235 [bacterium]|nr:MAG: hypothetical protein EHM76_00235 [bacterium]